MLTSDDDSSLVKNGSPDDTEMTDEVVDQVDAVIAALQKYRDKEPEVSSPNWYGYSPEPVPIEDSITQLKGNFVNSPDIDEIVSPDEGNPKRGVSIILEGTPEPDETVQNLSQDKVLNVLNDTLDLSNVIAQGSDEELDLDNDGWDLLMNTLPKYFLSVGSQRL